MTSTTPNETLSISSANSALPTDNDTAASVPARRSASASTSEATMTDPCSPSTSASRIDMSAVPASLIASPFFVNKTRKDAARCWDTYYKNNGTKGFKDRHWTAREFEALAQLADDATTAEMNDPSPNGKGKGKVVLEVGCGTGAFVYPLLEQYPNTRFHAFDFSAKAVSLVKANENFDPNRVHAFVHDLTNPPDQPSLLKQLESAPSAFLDVPGAVDRPEVISCVFVLSALPPDKQKNAIKSLIEVLAPGGTLLLRDYALNDEAQIRLHSRASANYATIPPLLSVQSAVSSSTTPSDDDNSNKPWYRRGDGTMTYFFTNEEISALVEQEGACENGYRMQGEVILVEKKLWNRKEAVKGERRFVQGAWKKVAK